MSGFKVFEVKAPKGWVGRVVYDLPRGAWKVAAAKIDGRMASYGWVGSDESSVNEVRELAEKRLADCIKKETNF